MVTVKVPGYLSEVLSVEVCSSQINMQISVFYSGGLVTSTGFTKNYISM